MSEVVSIKLSVLPVRTWLNSLIVRERQLGWGREAEPRVARSVGIELGQLRKLLKACGTITEEQVDELASSHGGIMVSDIYEYYKDGVKLPPTPRRRCARPGCGEPVDGTRPLKQDRKVVQIPSSHCLQHRLELARIREELDNEGKLMSDNGGERLTRSKPRNRRTAPVCCTANCWNPRLTGRRFCDECIDAGCSEEDCE